jgi:hypothetical protein
MKKLFFVTTAVLLIAGAPMIASAGPVNADQYRPQLDAAGDTVDQRVTITATDGPVIDQVTKVVTRACDAKARNDLAESPEEAMLNERDTCVKPQVARIMRDWNASHPGHN